MLSVNSKVLGLQYIIPAPLVSISNTPLRNKMGTLGCVYTITLNGRIIVPGGVTECKFLENILDQQNRLRQIFSRDGDELKISGGGIVGLKCNPNLVSIDFQEGPYLNNCSYTIVLEAPFLYDGDTQNILPEGQVSNFSPAKYEERSSDKYLYNPVPTNYDSIIARWGGVVEDFTDTWSLEYDNSLFQTMNNYSAGTDLSDDVQDIKIPHVYRLSRNINVVGRTIYDGADNKKTALDNAIGFLNKTLLERTPGRSVETTTEQEKYQLYPGYFGTGRGLSKKLLNIREHYKAYNHVRSINYDSNAGSCSVNDSWILASGDTALESYTASVDTSRDNARTTVKLNGTIQGLSNIHASGYQQAEYGSYITSTPYGQAIEKYYKISNDSKFGIGCGLYKRAKYLVPNNVTLNSQPLTVTLGNNENAGEITYSIEFDNRPQNYFTGVIGENISVNDTYPGDVYALIPVIGRQAGPVISYIRTRTVYSRSVNIEILLDPTDLPYTNDPQWADTTRNSLLLQKPSLNSTIRNELRDLVYNLSPFGEPSVSGCFLDPPQETWSPKEGRYTLSLNWNYGKYV